MKVNLIIDELFDQRTGLRLKGRSTGTWSAMNFLNIKRILTVKEDHFSCFPLTVSDFIFLIQEKVGDEKNISLIFSQLTLNIFCQACSWPLGSAVIRIMRLLEKKMDVIPFIPHIVSGLFGRRKSPCRNLCFSRKCRNFMSAAE